MTQDTPEETFTLRLAPDLVRELPVVTLAGSGARIASFVMLGDVELNERCARLLVARLESDGLLGRFDLLAAIEAKGITLAHETARRLGQPHVVIIRKSVKRYMVRPLTVPAVSITSEGEQRLVLDGRDAARVRGRRVCLVEDVIATGGSVRAACRLLEEAGAEVAVIAAVLLKGPYRDPRLVYLMQPPL
jgi:adenine phosphoribosyltransferase